MYILPWILRFSYSLFHLSYFWAILFFCFTCSVETFNHVTVLSFPRPQSHHAIIWWMLPLWLNINMTVWGKLPFPDLFSLFTQMGFSFCLISVAQLEALLLSPHPPTLPVQAGNSRALSIKIQAATVEAPDIGSSSSTPCWRQKLGMY